MTFIDTHCHIHDEEPFLAKGYGLKDIVSQSLSAGIEKMVCVGTDVETSQQAIKAARLFECLYASVALHPHEASIYSSSELEYKMRLLSDTVSDSLSERIIAVGECGLDYFYHKDQETQEKQKSLLKMHLNLAQQYNLPVIFHVRDAFEDFFAIMNDFPDTRGVIHSFTDSMDAMKEAVDRGFYIGLNGIMTFTKEDSQLEMAKHVPLDRLLLETDAPFLTPKPFRGNICRPEHIVHTAQFLSEIRKESLEKLSQATTYNARQFFGI